MNCACIESIENSWLNLWTGNETSTMPTKHPRCHCTNGVPIQFTHKYESTVPHCIWANVIVMCTYVYIETHTVWVYKQLVRYVECICLDRSVCMCGSIKRQIILVVKLNRFRLYSTRWVWCLLVLSYWPCSRSSFLSLLLSIWPLALSFVCALSFVRHFFFSHTHTHAYIVVLLFGCCFFSHSFSHRTARHTLASTTFTCTHANNQLLGFAIAIASVHFRLKWLLLLFYLKYRFHSLVNYSIWRMYKRTTP